MNSILLTETKKKSDPQPNISAIDTTEHNSDYFSQLELPTTDQAKNIINEIRAKNIKVEAEVTNRWIDTFYRTESNPDVIFVGVCGLGATILPLGYTADAVSENLSKNLKVSFGVTNLTGHARSFEESKTPTFADKLGHLHGIVKYLEHIAESRTPIVAVGHSTGCKVIESLMSLYPNMFTGYIAISPPTVLKNNCHALGLKLLKYLNILTPEILNMTFKNIKFPTTRNENRTAPEEILSGLLGNKEFPHQTLVQFQKARESGNIGLRNIATNKKIPFKTLLVTGGRDSLVDSMATAKYMQKLLRETFEHHHFENGSHQLQVGPHKEDIDKIIEKFIKNLLDF